MMVCKTIALADASSRVGHVVRPPRCSMISAESAESRPSPLTRVASRALTRRPRPRTGSYEEDGRGTETRRPTPIPVNGSVNGTRRDGLRWGRQPGCPETASPRLWCWAVMYETGRDGGDGRRTAHNPEVAGSNPAPA